MPHADPTATYEYCAYSMKLKRFGPMLRSYGHDAVTYGGEGTNVRTISDDDRQRWFGGEWDHQKVFDRWNPEDPCWTEANDAAITAIKQRIGPTDGIGIIAGRCQDQVAKAFPNNLILEFGVGYVGVLPYSLRCFESHSHQNYVHGFYQEDRGRFYDVVVPNGYDPDDFQFVDEPDDYLLFIGRPSQDKGIGIVAELAQRFRVVTAGQGPARFDGVEHRGIVRGVEKAELFARARAVLVTTLYREPFGGVSIEALMSGTPAITTDWGAFPENIAQGEDGFRCNTLGEFVDACSRVDNLDRRAIRSRARQRFSVDAIAPRYDEWLRRCEMLYGTGWYSLEPFRGNMRHEIMQH